jgi:DNA polymerase III alpha subunit (gram-positive type)
MHYLDELDEQLKGGAIGESYHIILLAKSQTGLVNLNRLVSISHLDYFRRRPHMPRSMIQKYREGLILGSACEAGELFRAVLRQDPWDKLKEMASFYDYLEIQPIGNNAFLIREGQVPDENALRDLNRQIVRLGEELGDYEMEVGSAGIGQPFKVAQQYVNHSGDEIEVLGNDGKKVQGVLKSVDGREFTLTVKEKQTVEGKERPVLVDVDKSYTMDGVKYAKYVLAFK